MTLARVSPCVSERTHRQANVRSVANFAHARRTMEISHVHNVHWPTLPVYRPGLQLLECRSSM